MHLFGLATKHAKFGSISLALLGIAAVCAIAKIEAGRHRGGVDRTVPEAFRTVLEEAEPCDSTSDGIPTDLEGENGCTGLQPPQEPVYAVLDPHGGVTGPTGPTTPGPGGPASPGPSGPATGGPIGPETGGPAGPATGGPPGPTTGGPAGPTTPGPTGPATGGPRGPTTGGPTGPTTGGWPWGQWWGGVGPHVPDPDPDTEKTVRAGTSGLPLFDRQPNHYCQGLSILSELQHGSVNTGTQGFVWGEIDAAYTGVTSYSGLVIGRRYFSRLEHDGVGSTGVRWVSSITEQLIEQTTSDGKRALQHFDWKQPFNDPDFWFVEQVANSGVYTTSPAIGAIITWQGNGYELAFKDGSHHYFDEIGRITQRRDAFGNTITFTYDVEPAQPTQASQQSAPPPSGSTILITDSRGKTFTVAVDSLGYIASITDPAAATVTYQYQTVGTTRYLTGVLYPARQVWEPGDTVVTRATTRGYTYNANGRLQDVRDDSGNTRVHNVYSPSFPGCVTTQTSVSGATWQFTVNGAQTDVLTPKGFKRVYLHNGKKQVIEVRQYVANFLNGPARTTDPLVYHRWLFDRADVSCNCGPIIGITEPDGGDVQIVYSAAFDMLEVHKRAPDHSLELVWKWTYDSQHRIATFIPPEGNASIDPAPYTTTITRQIVSGNLVETTTVPPRSWRASPSVWVTTSDSLGRVIEVHGPPHDGSIDSFAGKWTYFAAGSGSSAFLPYQCYLRDASTVAYTYQWDACGRVTGITGQGNVQYSCSYDWQGRPTAWQAPAIGNQVYRHEWYYDGNGMLRRLRWKYYADDNDANGAWIEWKYVYDSAGQPLQQTKQLDANGASAVSTWQYDLQGNVTQAVDPDGQTSTVIYDERDLPWQLSDGVGTTEVTSREYTYDDDGRLSVAVDQLDATRQVRFENEYDAFDRLARYRIRNQANQAQEAGYVEADYDAGSRVTELRTYGISGGTSQLVEKKSFVYDDFHDSPTQQTTYVYKVDDGSLLRTVPSYFIYGPSGRPLAELTASVVVAVYSYETWGAPKRVEDAHGNIAEFTWNDYGQVLTETDTHSNPVLGSPLVTTRTFVRDVFGRATAITDSGTGMPSQTHTYAYDSADNVARHTGPDGSTTTCQYRYDGLLVREDQVISGSTLRATQYQYTAGGRKHVVTDDRNNNVTYVYDGRGRLKQEVYPDASTWTNSYNNGGLLTQIVGPSGRTVDLAYDWRGMLLTATYKNGAGAVQRTDTMVIDLGGFIKRVTKVENGQTSYVEMPHDGMGLVLSETVSNPGQPVTTVTYGRDSFGRLTSITGTSGAAHVYTYDDRDRVSSVTRREGGLDHLIATYEYLGSGRAQTRRVTADGNTMLVTRDGFGRTTRMLTNGASNVADFQYGYDSGNRVNYELRAFEGKGDVYWYDKLGRLTQTTRDSLNPVAELQAPQSTTHSYFRSFLLDGDDHRTQVTTTPMGGSSVQTNYTTHSSRHEYTQIQTVGQPAVLRAFDIDGRLTANGSRTFTYDIADNLTSVIDGGSTTATYTYDALGRRATKVVNGTTTRYVYAGPWLIEEYQTPTGAAETLEGTYYHGPGIDDVVMMHHCDCADLDGDQDVTEKIDLYLHRNKLGSVTEITDSTGSVVERCRYDDFGKPTVMTAPGTVLPQSAVGNLFFFTSRIYDVETGLYDYRARVYDPETGTFLQEDPLGMQDGVNVVAYVHANPVGLADPYGTEGVGEIVDSILGFINEHRDIVAGLVMDLLGPLEGVVDLLSAATGKDYTGWLRGGLKGEPEAMGWWDRACAAASAAIKIAAGAINLIPKLKKIFNKIKEVVDAVLNKAEKKARQVLCKLTGGCFVLGTAVLMGNGDLIPIETVSAGALVQSEVPAALPTSQGTQLSRRVEDAGSRPYVGALISIEVMDAATSRRDTITATPEHKFWSVTQHSWVAASALHEGDMLDGSVGRVRVVRRFVAFGQCRVFNFEVAETHTYRVSRLGVLVHNPGEKKCWTVYEGLDKETGQPYIGRTSREPEVRWKEHGDRFEGKPKILEQGVGDTRAAREAEQKWIDKKGVPRDTLANKRNEIAK